MTKKRFELSLQCTFIMYIMKVYGLGIHFKKTFTNMVHEVKHTDYMDSKGKKELEEFCLLKLNVVVLQI